MKSVKKIKQHFNSCELIQNKTVLETIRKYLTVRDSEKKQFGEVFTPVELVCDMLDQLPKEVWNDPTLKWLDPANGIGNYPVVAYYKLMDGLKEVKGYEDKVKRSKHIIENMLFMVELNPINCKVCRKIFKMIDSNAKPNIYNSPFYTDKESNLTETWTKKCPVKNFDIIMGNPPYQKQKEGVSKGHANTQPIWPDFIEHSVNNYLNKNGYLVFVNPSGWRDLKGHFKNIFNLFKERDLQHLTMRTYKDGSNTFGGSGTNFDYYCLKNTLTKTNKTKINDIDRKNLELDLNNYDFIPSGKFNIFEKLVQTNNTVTLIAGSTYHHTHENVKDIPKPYREFKYPVVYTITQKEGIKCRYTDIKKGMFVPKVIWSDGAGTYPIIDDKGKYGLTQFSYGIQDKPEVLNYIKNAMNDKKFIELMKYVRFGAAHKYNRKIIGTFKKDFWKQFDYKTEQIQVKTKKKKNMRYGPKSKIKIK
jgi:hypothetical protein